VTDSRARIALPRQLVVGNRESFKVQVLNEIDAGQRHFAFDLAECSYLDSAGLGTLLVLQKRIKALAGTLTLENPNDDVRELFALTKLDTVFKIVPEKPEKKRRR
jgi:anti-sigma B factor antagonist